MHLARVFFERSPKVQSFVNRLPGEVQHTSTIAPDMEADGASNNFQSENFANSSQYENFGVIDQSASAHVSNNGALSNPSPTADLEVGIEISPVVERRNSAALL